MLLLTRKYSHYFNRSEFWAVYSRLYFLLMRSLIDREHVAGRFLLLGSASPDLLKNSSETLAGRIAYLELHPLQLVEVGDEISYITHWLRGGYPAILQAGSDRLSTRRMSDFINTYIERDLPLLGYLGIRIM